MSTPVTYELNLKDNFSSTINKAEGEANKFEHQLDRVKSVGAELGSVLLAAFSVYKIIEFIQKSDELYENLEKANAQLKAGLESTGYAAGVTMSDLEDDQTSFRQKVDYSKSSLADMQAQLLTFPKISKSIFGETEQAILDMATRLHHGLDETAIMVGKALQDPERGIMALRRVGVNFNETQTEMIKKLVETGHAAEAQLFILRELQTEFAGSAEAEAGANPYFEFDKAIEELQLDLGELVKELKIEFGPVLISVAHWLKDVVDWIKRNREEIESLVKILAIAYGAYKAISIAIGIISSIGIAVQGLAAEETVAVATTTQFSGAMDLLQASLGPIIIALTAIVGLYSSLSDSMITVEEMQGSLTTENIKNIKTNVSLDLQTNTLFHDEIRDKSKQAQQGYEDTKSEYEKQLKDAQKTVDNFKALDNDVFNMGGFFINKSSDYQDAVAQITVLTQKLKTLDDLHTGVGLKKPGINVPSLPPVDKGTKASASKNINIKIDIRELVHELKIQTTTFSEGIAKAKDLVTAALISAVNDSQIVAGE